MSSGGTPFSVCLSQGTHLKESKMVKSLTWDRQGKKVTGLPNLRSSSPFRPQSVGHGATPQAVVEAPAPPAPLYSTRAHFVERAVAQALGHCLPPPRPAPGCLP